MTYPDIAGNETPEADAAEQAVEAFPGDDYDTSDAQSSDVEAPEWDAQEQRQTVQMDDDYR